MADSRKNKNRCSFCGRTEDEVGFLITGMNGYICDSCATQAYEITQEALGAGKKASATKLNLKELPKPVEIKKFLFFTNGVFSISAKYISSSNSSVKYPLIALKAATSGDTK